MDSEDISKAVTLQQLECHSIYVLIECQYKLRLHNNSTLQANSDASKCVLLKQSSRKYRYRCKEITWCSPKKNRLVSPNTMWLSGKQQFNKNQDFLCPGTIGLHKAGPLLSLLNFNSEISSNVFSNYNLTFYFQKYENTYLGFSAFRIIMTVPPQPHIQHI